MNRVVAVTATYRRAFEVGRLLDALQASEVPLHGVVVVDNACDSATRERLQKSTITVEYVDAGGNLGCGGGLRQATARSAALASTDS